jgi:hypothetical protein
MRPVGDGAKRPTAIFSLLVVIFVCKGTKKIVNCALGFAAFFQKRIVDCEFFRTFAP